MATNLTPPGGLKATLTVDDESVDRYLASGWTRADGATAGLPEPENTEVLTYTGGPEADNDDRHIVGTLVSDSLGDEDVLVTDFGRPGDEPVKGGTEPLPSAGATDNGDSVAGVRESKARTAKPRGAKADADKQD